MQLGALTLECDPELFGVAGDTGPTGDERGDIEPHAERSLAHPATAEKRSAQA
jgi:hypothetical protein